jgi:hypothetical protein
VLPVEPQAGADVLYRLQVTARTWLGAFALHAGAVLRARVSRDRA